ncbi:MAG: hypothetical protein ACUVUE_04595 [Candidatus Bathycorpusculaceae bacterium]
MEASFKKSWTKKFLGLAAVIVVLLSVAYLVVTYPRVTINFSVSFTVGADIKRVDFEVPFLHDYVNVEVFVRTGTAIWTAKILDGDDALWSHTASQSSQTTYSSEWVKIPSGRYNFTFAAAGIRSLEAEIKLTSKGGFW